MMDERRSGAERHRDCVKATGREPKKSYWYSRIFHRDTGFRRFPIPFPARFPMLCFTAAAVAFAPIPLRAPTSRCAARSSGSAICANVAAADIATAKTELLDSIAAYNELIAVDGVPSVDFGVSGGELDKDSRAPRDLLAAGAFEAVSPRVGSAADRVVAAVEAIAKVNPTPNPTEGLGSKDGASVCKLHGRWYNAFTTAADATFSADSKRGDAAVSNEVDASKGRMTNIIEFFPKDHPAFVATRTPPKPPPVQSLNVILSCSAASPTRVELVFRRVRVRLTKLFGKPRTLVLPVPGPFFTRIKFLFRPKKVL